MAPIFGSKFKLPRELVCSFIFAIMLSAVRTATVRAPAVRSFAAVASPWGSDTWRYDKNACLSWCTEAVGRKESAAKRELHSRLAIRFGESDVD